MNLAMVDGPTLQGIAMMIASCTGAFTVAYGVFNSPRWAALFVDRIALINQRDAARSDLLAAETHAKAATAMADTFRNLSEAFEERIKRIERVFPIAIKFIVSLTNHHTIVEKRARDAGVDLSDLVQPSIPPELEEYINH